MTFSDLQRARLSLALVGLTVVILGISGCSVAESEAQAIAPDTVALTPALGDVAVAPAAAPASVASATSQPPTTQPVTTAPVTTAPAATATTVAVETTTTLPPTTLPTTTTSTLAINEEEVGVWPAPIPAVGKRSGEDTKVVQSRLLQLGFWLSAVDGDYGLTTRQAVMAFQKYVGLPANGEVTTDTAAYLTNLGIKGHGQTDTGTLIEIDKAKQLLFIVVDGKTVWVMNTSTATGLPYSEEDKNTPGEIQTGVSITPNGLWRTNRERPEGWWEGDLGQIYRPKYFRGGVAVHGSNSIPNYPASHGCVRLSVPAMDFIWDNNLMPLKTTVWVHE